MFVDPLEGLPVDASSTAISTTARVGFVEDVLPADLVPKAIESVAWFALGFRVQGLLQLLNRTFRAW